MPAVAPETTDILDAEVVGEDRPHGDPVVVLLHGFDMLPGDLSPFAASLALPARFVLPRAPIDLRARGMHGCAWWECDAHARDAVHESGNARDLSDVVPGGLALARSRIAAFLTTIRETLAPRTLVLGGFSQGAMLSLDVSLRADAFPEALMLLSGTPLATREWGSSLSRVKGQRIFLSHGQSDPDLSFTGAESLRDALVAAGANVTWVPFAGGHETPLVVWRQVRRFLTGVLDHQISG